MHDQLYRSITAIGSVVLLLGLFSEPVRRKPVSEPLLTLLLGVILGPAILGWITPAQWLDDPMRLLMEAARLTVAIGLMGVALRLPGRYFVKHWRSLVMLLGPVMILMWLAGGLLSWGLLGIGIWGGAAAGRLRRADGPGAGQCDRLGAIRAGKPARPAAPCDLG